MRGAVGDGVGKCECFVMHMLYARILGASYSSSQCCFLHEFLHVFPPMIYLVKTSDLFPPMIYLVHCVYWVVVILCAVYEFWV